MSSIVGLRSRRLVLATVAIFAVAGGIAYAAIPDTGGVFHACVMKNGSVRIIDPDTDQCKQNESAITFNQKGQTGDPGPQGPAGTNGTNGTNGTDGTNGAPGQPGVSPTVTQLAVNDPNCPAGGAAITDAAQHTAYVCGGTPFSGTFTSPNGKYKISVTDTGVTVVGADTTLALTATGMRVDAHGSSSITLMSSNDLLLRSADAATLEAGNGLTLTGQNTLTATGGASFDLSAGGTGTVSGGALLSLTGSFLMLNPGVACPPAARAGDSVAGGVIVTGAGTVCIGG